MTHIKDTIEAIFLKFNKDYYDIAIKRLEKEQEEWEEYEREVADTNEV